MKKSDIPALGRVDPPTALARLVQGFVARDEDPGAQVVHVLPEVRSSIQIMVAEPYWLRDAHEGAPWRRLPRMALWGPRYDWCYGFASGRIKAYGLALTAAGLITLSNRPTSALVNEVLDLHDLHPALAAALSPTGEESLSSWSERASAALAAHFVASPSANDPIAPTLGILATAEANAVERAAAHAGLSERQYRRLFAHFYGVSPKQYQRAIRVDRMIRQLHERPWETDQYGDVPIAFADQPHAIREFRALTGVTPGDYIRIKRKGGATLRSLPTNHVAPPEL